MTCPYCQMPGAYVSALSIECANLHCEHYAPHQAIPEDAKTPLPAANVQHSAWWPGQRR